MRPTWAEINLESLKSNFREVKRIIGEDVNVLSIVKADAYGHGAVPCSRALIDSGSDMLGVATIDEGIELREAGINIPIVLLAGVQFEDAEVIIKNRLTPFLFSLKTAEILNRYACRNDKTVKYHLKVDTGMSRLGVGIDQVVSFLNDLRAFRNLEMEGVVTHLATADKDDRDYTLKQISDFDKILSLVKESGFNPKYLHTANSAAVQRFPESHKNLVRPGIMLYGSGNSTNLKLKPVMKLKSRVLNLQKISPGTPVSYGGTFIARRTSVIATLPIGYADGYMRILSNRARVSINGTTAPVVGTLCMDLTLIDLTDVPGVSVGDEVVLLGDERVSVEDVASWAETISYEILSTIGQRVPRVYI